MKPAQQTLKIGIILMVLLGSSLSLKAQELPGTVGNSGISRPLVKRNGTWGFKMGLSISNFSGSDAEGLDPRITYAHGGFFIYGNKSTAFQSEIRYVQKGVNIDMDGITASIKFSYIEIPLLFKFHNPLADGIKNADKGQRMLYFGPVLNIKLSSILTLSDSDASASVNLKNAKTVVCDLAVGADVCWPMGKTGNFYLDARFNFGLTNPFDDAEPSGGNFVDENGEALQLKHISFNLMTGFAF